MFGFSFSELVVVVIVTLVVMGPKDLPKVLRRLGQWAGKIRRAAADLRAQSGIDDALRSEGLADDIAEIRKLARGELDAVQRMARIDDASRPVTQDPYRPPDDFHVARDREYPRDGADAYGALPDNAVVYAETFPRSAWARDPLYMMGDAEAELPEPRGAVGPTLLGGVGLPVPYEPPAPSEDSQAAGPTLTGIVPSEVERSDDGASDDSETSAEARS